MGLFDIFKGGGERSEIWKELDKIEDVPKLVEDSYQNTVVIFKHSTRCFISKTVLKNFEKNLEEHSFTASFYFLDLLKHRDVSNRIAEVLEVTHHSPQLIVLKEGKVLRHASHDAISIDLI